MFSYESANDKIPDYWDRVHAETKAVMGKYGICFDEEMAGDQFRYLIADDFYRRRKQERGWKNM